MKALRKRKEAVPGQAGEPGSGPSTCKVQEGDSSHPQFLSVKEAAAWLRVDRKTIYTAIARGDLSIIRLGRVVRIPVESVLAKVASGRRTRS